MGELYADGAVDMPRHWSEAAWLAEILTLLELDVIAKPGQMRASIGEHDPARRQNAPDRLSKLTRVDVADDVRYDAGLIVTSVDLHRRPRPDLGLERLVQCLDRRLRIRDDRCVGLVDLVNLHLGDINVDELAALEQVLAIAEGRMLVQRITDGEHHVGLKEGLPGAGMAAVAEDTDR